MKTASKFFQPAYLMLAVGLGVGFLGGIYAGRQSVDRQSGADLKADEAGAGGWRRSRERAGVENQGNGAASRKARASLTQGKELAESVSTIFSESIESRRVAMFEALLDQLGDEQFSELVSLIQENQMTGMYCGIEWMKLWESWGKRDPIAAFEFLQTQGWTGSEPSTVKDAGSKVLVSWAQADPERARKFVEEGELANGDRSQVYGLVRGWADVDPDAATEWLVKTGLGMRMEYMAVVDSLSRKRGTDGLDSWFASLVQQGIPVKDQAGFAQQVTRVKAGHDPEGAATWIEQHMDEPWMNHSIVQTTATAYAHRDPRAAMEWAAGVGTEGATNAAMAVWAERDLPAAAAWFSENSGNPAVQGSVGAFWNRFLMNDPEAARSWAEGIPDPAMRSTLMKQLEQRQAKTGN